MDSGDMALLAAVLNDERYAARLKQFQESQDTIDRSSKDLAAQRAENDAVLAESRKLVENMNEREAAATDLEKRLAEGWKTLNEEKDKWETVVRQPTDKMQADKETELLAREKAVGGREEAVTKREADVDLREKTTADGVAALSIKHRNLQAAIEANEVVEPMRPPASEVSTETHETF